MTTCCPNCSSSAAVGNELASACADCMSVSAAGGSMSMAMLVGLAAGVIGVVYIARSMRRVLGGRLMLSRVRA